METVNPHPLCPSTIRLARVVALALLLVVASLAFLAGNAFASVEPPNHVVVLPIVDPCWGCACPTPAADSKPNGDEPRPLPVTFYLWCQSH
jgi:hypothetical protein